MAARNALFAAAARALAPLRKAVVPVTSVPGYAVSGGTWWGAVRESFAGAWQNGVTVDPRDTLLAFSAVYACVTLIADDISKLRIKLMAYDKGVWQETANPAFSPVLRKPNNYQTRIQFLNQWVQSKLIYGNSYILKMRDERNVITDLYVLDPRLVKPLVTDDGQVFYQVGTDRLLGRTASFTVPASEVIHDRAVCFFHPLIGVGPLYACALSATQGNRIQQNSAKFFENMSRPSGTLTAPGVISDETAKRLKAEFESNFSGANLGRLLVTGDGLKYEAMTIPAQQAQMIEQLRWTVEDVARCFHVPLHKLSSDVTLKFTNMAAMNQDYYSQTLQVLIESIELLLDEGLGLATGGPQALGVELDLEGLLRMDPVQRADRTASLVKGAVMSPNEGRLIENLPPVTGGEEPFMQQQNYPLSVLAKQPPPGTMNAPAPAPAAPAPAPAATPAAAVLDGKAAKDAEVTDQIAKLMERIEQQANDMLAAQATIRAADEKAAELHAKESEAVRAIADESRAAIAEQLAQAKTLADEARAVSAQRLELDQMTECVEFGQALIERLTNAEHLV